MLKSCCTGRRGLGRLRGAFSADGRTLDKRGFPSTTRFAPPPPTTYCLLDALASGVTMTDAPLSPTSTLHGSPTPSGNKSADCADMAEKGHVSPYDGEGTEASPLIVKYLENDKTNPQNWSPRTKWYARRRS